MSISTHFSRRLGSIAAAAAVLATAGSVGAQPVPEQSAPVAPTSDAYGYADFYGVPHLGAETAAGTGCGGDGSIGDTIPDGYWRGYVDGLTPGAIQFDLVCVYGNDVNPDLITKWREQHPGQADPWVPDGYLINADERVRSVPVGPGFFSHGTAFGSDQSCSFNQPDVAFDGTRDVWLRIVNGQAAWAVSGCTAAPTTPAFNFPYATFWGVPQLGNESVRGTGCGGDSSIGDTIPDGIWFGWVRALDDTAMQFDLSCIYIGETGQRLQDEWDAVPEHQEDLEMDQTGLLVRMPYGWEVNNSSRTRTVPLQDNFLTAWSSYSDNDPNWPGTDPNVTQCVPPVDPTIVPEGEYFDPNAADENGVPYAFSGGVWLNIVNGEAQWILVNCQRGG